MRYAYMLSALLLGCVTACADDKPDYRASAECQESGHKPGTAGYDSCVKEAKANRLMQEQRADYERMKRQQEDWKLRRY